MRSTHPLSIAAAVVAALLTMPASAAADFKTWYLAEGATGFFEEEILIGNPNAVDAHVTIDYLLPAGQTGLKKQLVVAATSRATVRVNDDVPAAAVSAVITSDRDIVVERSMYWGGLPGYAGRPRLGGHNANGVMTPPPEWYLAEGVSNAVFDEFILVSNPNPEPTVVEIAYLGTDGVRDVDTYRIAASSRRTIWVRVDLEARFHGRFRNRTFSAIVRTRDRKDIIVERSIYWGGLFVGGLDPGGTNASGLTSTGTIWRFAEGFTGAGFQTFVLIGNPTDRDAAVAVTFYFEDGTTAVEHRRVRANSRASVWVNAEIRRAHERPFSIVVESTNGVGIVAERAMYWGNLREGHVVTGLRAEATMWAFAEGMEGRHAGYEYDAYYLLANTRDTEASVRVLFLLEDGTGVERTFTIAPNSRFTLAAGRLAALVGRKFAAFFEATNGTPIVTERAVYWGPGYQGGHASAGTPWTGGIATPVTLETGALR